MTVKIFGPERYRNFLDEQFNKLTKHDDIKITCVPNATVCGDGRPRVHGVYDSVGRYVAESNIVIKNAEKLRRSSCRASQYIDEDVLFLGNLHHHFGHVLLERLTRAWALGDKKFHGMKCVLLYSRAAENIPSYYMDILQALGVSADKIIIVRRPMRFRNVFVPDISKGPDFYSNMYAKTFDAIASAVPDCPVHEKIYVSRGALKKRRTFGERRVQAVFERNGFHVIYPEKMTITDQISMIKNCRVLAGCAGTALHLALFMKPGGTVIQIKRNSKAQDNANEQYLINKSKKLDSVFIWASDERRQTPHFTNAPQIIAAGHYMCEFWNYARMKYSPADLITDAKEYDAYYAAWHEYRRKYGFSNKLKRTIIKVMVCFIPGRTPRGTFRLWMKKKLGCVDE